MGHIAPPRKPRDDADDVPTDDDLEGGMVPDLTGLDPIPDEDDG